MDIWTKHNQQASGRPDRRFRAEEGQGFREAPKETAEGHGGTETETSEAKRLCPETAG